MSVPAKEFGVIGLGRMGGNLTHHALELGMKAVGFTRHGAPAELLAAGLVEIRGYDGFRAHLQPPRAVFIYVPAGPIVDSVIDDLLPHLETGDIVVDGGNSYWGDSIRRHQ